MVRVETARGDGTWWRFEDWRLETVNGVESGRRQTRPRIKCIGMGIGGRGREGVRIPQVIICRKPQPQSYVTALLD